VDDLARRSSRGLLGFVLALGALLFLPAWTLAFWQGWVYWLIFSGALLAITAYFLKTDPALVERRLRAGPAGEKEKVQTVIQSLTSLVLCALLVVPGLDRHFGWSHVPVAAVGVADALVVVAFLMFVAVFKANTYTSGIVEVDANQEVISSGPYALVRHPMYAGALLLFLATPLALGSWWDLLVVVPMAAALIWRLLAEERFLSDQLSGYQAYCARVRSRLLPGLW
jgi:protein-S-isoprenylcysteine O-methyltransferase Ste14